MTKRSENRIRDERPGNFFIIDNEVVDTYLPVIGSTTFAVYAYLARRAGNKESTYPSIARVAKDLGMSPATVSRSIGVLAGNVIKTDNKRDPFSLLGEAGLPPLIRVEPHYGDDGGLQTTSTYILNKVTSPVEVRSLTSEGPGTSPVRDRAPHQWGTEEDSGKKTQEEDFSDTSPKSPNGVTPHDLMMAWSNLTGIRLDSLTTPGKHYAAAKKLVNANYTPERLAGLYEFAQSHFKGRNGVTMAIMADVSDEYKVTLNKNPNKSNPAPYQRH